jgi:glucose/arabinose dehydrogenase
VRRLGLLCLLAAILAGCGGEDRKDPREEVRPLRPATEGGRARHFDVERLASGLNRPTFVGVAPGDGDGLWVLEQPGRVVRLTGERRRTALDLTGEVRTGAEQGLLGMAFHPDFASNRRLYLHWTNRAGDTRVAEFRAGRDGTIDPRPLRELLAVEQPEENHKGGQLAFGPDGRLYVGLGDGGGAFDPRQTAQDPSARLGKVLAAELEAPRPRWTVILTGLRNPWRFAFDPALGEIWVADVGQDEIEEVNRVLLEPDEPPKNLGWSAFEGTRRLARARRLDATGELIWPVAAYTHAHGCSVIGGLVYRGTAIPALSGRYVYGDFCSATLWSLRGTPGGRAEDVRRERARVPQLTHIGTDADGELLLASATGQLYRAVPPAAG